MPLENFGFVKQPDAKNSDPRKTPKGKESMPQRAKWSSKKKADEDSQGLIKPVVPNSKSIFSLFDSSPEASSSPA
jgi:hypothetical protein